MAATTNIFSDKNINSNSFTNMDAVSGFVIKAEKKPSIALFGLGDLANKA